MYVNYYGKIILLTIGEKEQIVIKLVQVYIQCAVRKKVCIFENKKQNEDESKYIYLNFALSIEKENHPVDI